MDVTHGRAMGGRRQNHGPGLNDARCVATSLAWAHRWNAISWGDRGRRATWDSAWTAALPWPKDLHPASFLLCSSSGRIPKPPAWSADPATCPWASARGHPTPDAGVAPAMPPEETGLRGQCILRKSPLHRRPRKGLPDRMNAVRECSETAEAVPAEAKGARSSGRRPQRLSPEG